MLTKGKGADWTAGDMCLNLECLNGSIKEVEFDDEQRENVWNFILIILSVVDVVVIERGWVRIGGMFSWWFDDILIDCERGSKLSNVLINDVDGGDDGSGRRLSVVILVESVLKRNPWLACEKIMIVFLTRLDVREVEVEFLNQCVQWTKTCSYPALSIHTKKKCNILFEGKKKEVLVLCNVSFHATQQLDKTISSVYLVLEDNDI